MKKLLVLLVSAVMVLSMAAVSMAAVNVSADWRAEWVSQESVADGDFGFSKYDLRFNFDGKVSDTIDGHLQMTYDGEKTFAVKEYWAIFKQSFGTFQAGTWDYKLIPSRVLIKPHGVNCLNEKSMQFVETVKISDAFSAGLYVIPDLKDGMANYDLKFAYNAEKWGAEVHYGDDPATGADDYYAFDVYFKPINDLKLFAFGIDAKKGTIGVKNVWDDDFASAIGAQWSKIGGSALTASLEYGLETCSAGGKKPEFDPIAIQLKYGFNNKLALEVEYTNYKDNTEDDYIVIRPRVKF